MEAGTFRNSREFTKNKSGQSKPFRFSEKTFRKVHQERYLQISERYLAKIFLRQDSSDSTHTITELKYCLTHTDSPNMEVEIW